MQNIAKVEVTMKYLHFISVQLVLAVFPTATYALQQNPNAGGMSSTSSSRRDFLNQGVAAAGIAAGSASLWIPSSASAVVSETPKPLKLPPMGLGCWGKLPFLYSTHNARVIVLFIQTDRSIMGLFLFCLSKHGETQYFGAILARTMLN